MEASASVLLYSVVIVLGAVSGAVIAFWTGRKAGQVALLAFAAGAMFGAAFFHMLPEAFHSGGYSAFTAVPIGFLVLFLLERYVLVHVCEEPPDCEEHALHRSSGLAAFWGLSAHTLFDGVALGSAVGEGIGLTAFVAIAAHKVPSSVALSALLQHEGRSRGRVIFLAALYGLMVPLGAALFFLVSSWLPLTRVSSRTLAFSAGTFLYIAVSDLLPHVSRHGKGGRLGSLAGLMIGLLVMLGLSWMGGHEHGAP